jgi:hypothetical protein
MQCSKVTPAQLAGLSLLSSLIAASAFFLAPIYRHLHNASFRTGSSVSLLIAMMAILCGGGYLSIWTNQELKNGVQAARWSDAQLRPLRSFFNSWHVKIASGALIAALLVLLVVDVVHSNPHSFSPFWACFILNQGLTSLRGSLAEPKPSQQSRLYPAAPLQSEHWGESSKLS